DHDGVITELLPERQDGPLPDPAGVPCLRSLGVLALGDAEDHEGEDPALADLGRLLPEELDRVLHLAGHRGDRDGFVDRLLDEERRDQVRGTNVGLADQLAERGGPPETARPLLREGHRAPAYPRGLNERISRTDTPPNRGVAEGQLIGIHSPTKRFRSRRGPEERSPARDDETHASRRRP